MKHKLSQFGLAAVVALTMVMPGVVIGADTFRLGDNQWRNVADSPDSEYTQAMSNLKQQVSKGQINAVNDSILKIKSDFPEKTGPDFDSYMKGEVLYTEAKWAKAVDAYDVFLDSFPNSPLYESALDLYEQVQRCRSLAEMHYALVDDLQNAYIALASHRLNQVMRVLTVITVIFVPLSFLAGIYGMNFEDIPGVKSSAGFFVLLAVMIVITLGLLALFRRKGWL